MVKLNDEGFASVLVLVIIGIIAIGGVGYYVYHANKQVNDTLDNAKTQNQAQADQYAGWKTFTSKEKNKVSFKYPSSWKLEDNSDSFGPGAYLTAKDGFSVNVDYGTEHPSLDYRPSVAYARPVSFMGSNDYMDFISGTKEHGTAGLVESVQLSTATTDPVNNAPAHGGNYVDIDASTKKPESLTAAKADADYKNVALLIESFKVGD